MQQLTGAQRRFLRAEAHPLRAVVQIGKQGLTPGALAEIGSALNAHELIKVRFVDHKERKEELSHAMEEKLGAVCAGLIGSIAILYRPNPDKPDPLRLP